MSKHENAIRKRRRGATRTGTAAVELAVCLPVVMVIVWGALDLANMLHTRNAAQAAAYSAVSVAVADGGTDAQVISTCQSILQQRGITNATVTVSHPTVNGMGATQVTIKVPPQTNLSGKWLYSGTIEANCLAVNHAGSSSSPPPPPPPPPPGKKKKK
jgi:Flp pilus assembly protein TadG